MPSIPHESAYLPVEILQKIASHLDKESAANLARTCKALRDAGEMKLWEEIDIRSNFDHVAAQQAGLTGADRDVHEQTSRRQLKRVQTNLSSYPFRNECISRLAVDLLDVDATAPILTGLAPRLESLALIPLPVHLTDNQGLLKQFYARINRDIPSWPRLKHLRLLPLDLKIQSPDVYLSQLLGRMPVIESLEISGIEECPPNNVKYPDIPTLRSLKIDEFDSSFIPTLQRILAAAPNIQQLILGGWDLSDAKRDRDAFQALRDHTGLRSLVWLFNDVESRLHYMTRSKGMVNLEELVEKVEDFDEVEELFLSTEIIPRHTNVKRFCAFTGPRPAPAQFATLGIAPFQTDILRIDTPIVRKLLHAKNLVTVQYTADPNDVTITLVTRHHWKPDSPIFVPSTEWEARGIRGVVIRSYGPGDLLHTLVHTRTLSRVVEHESGEVYVGAQRCWTDHTSFRNRTVPREVMEQVCGVSGGVMSMDWVEGGRGLELGREGERILREWWESVGDEGGDSDNYSEEESDVDEDEDEDEEGIQRGYEISDNSWETDEEDA